MHPCRTGAQSIRSVYSHVTCHLKTNKLLDTSPSTSCFKDVVTLLVVAWPFVAAPGLELVIKYVAPTIFTSTLSIKRKKVFGGRATSQSFSILYFSFLSLSLSSLKKVSALCLLQLFDNGIYSV